MTANQELKIRWEWEAAAQARAPEHRATWARIEIMAGPDFVTLAEDRESGSSRRSIYCPLYPLAEWIAYNWWFLQADTRPSSFLSQDLGVVAQASPTLPRAMQDHHSIRASGDGFAWPNLVIVPDGPETRLVWQSDRARSSNWPIRFLTHGDCRVGSELVQHEFELVVTETLTRLSEQGVTGTVLENEWAAIQQTGREEAEYCRAAARLGLDPYADAEPYEQDIMQVGETLSGEVLTDFLNAVNPQHIGRALTWVSSGRSVIERRPAAREALRPSESNAPEAGLLQELRAKRRELVSALGAPWDVGYQQARAIRRQIAPDATARLAVDRYVLSRSRQAPDASLQALGASADQLQPLVIVGQRRPVTSNRFTLSRALWHCIWDDSPLFIVTTAHTHRQRVERAFAAELLAPADGIAALLESPPEAASQEELEQIAQRFGVSSMVIEHQVRNHLIAA
ncbi:MAG: ImmA/IrrE family metallo-endopeptidase [Streptosporangiaceae bacterium]